MIKENCKLIEGLKNMQIKTSELVGINLDWAVAFALNKIKGTDMPKYYEQLDCLGYYDFHDDEYTPFQPTTDWVIGGEIIESEGISILNLDANSWDVSGWQAERGELWSPVDDGLVSKTPLEAVMRCFVLTHVGISIDVPEEFQ